MALILTLYNHKGGVSKTTTTFNLGHRLAEVTGDNVLLVDADPQCNLTELFLGNQVDADEPLPGTSLLDALRPRLEGRAHRVDVDSINLVESQYNPRVQLFRGDIDLNGAEDQFATAHSQRLTDDIHYKYTYVAIHDTLRRLSERVNARFVLIDVGPSAGALTRSCFLSADAFFVPTAPDRFNVQAIGSLARIIGRWLREHHQIVDDFKTLGLPVSHGQPLFLGTIAQNFKLSRGNKPKPGFELWLQRVPVRVQDELVPVLEAASKRRDLLSICRQRGTFEAVQIPDFVSIVTLMQEYAKPIYAITRQDTALIGHNQIAYSGAVWADTEKRLVDWQHLFDELVGIVLQAEAYLRD